LKAKTIKKRNLGEKREKSTRKMEERSQPPCEAIGGRVQRGRKGGRGPGYQR